MINIEELNSEGIKIIEKKDFEVINCVAKKENNEETSFLVKNKLAEKFKNPKYKILVYGKKTIILTENKEQMDFLAFSFDSQKAVDFGIFKETPKPKIISELEANIQKWCNEIQKYLENILGFGGIIKVKAAGLNDELIVFDIIASGKGTNNKIVKILKELSNDFTDDLLYCDKDEIFTTLDNYFKS